ncbi:hypothetical protein MKW94_006909 [Papaver nudicaule]|uniref:nucleoside-diphosphate kinase n=1 Tax=Papaver nudicaule TaxID=74823 RepID=A0AA41SDC4_PAPNU|nr:hypothetical protein [Papaver nudicaule]
MGDIVTCFEEANMKLKGMRLMHVNADFIRKHFDRVGGEPQGKHPRLTWVSYLTNRPVIAMILEGHEAAHRVHEMTSTQQEESLFWFDGGPTAYSSDTVERADKDIKMWFSQDSQDWFGRSFTSTHLVYLLPEGETHGPSEEAYEMLRNDAFCNRQPNLHAYFPTDDMSLVVIKPKAFRECCVGDILTAVENSSHGVRGLKLVRKADFPESDDLWCASGETDDDECAVAVVVNSLCAEFQLLCDEPDTKHIDFELGEYLFGNLFPYGMTLWVHPGGKYLCGMNFEATLVGLDSED